MAIAFYYPEGPMGPVCDYFIDDEGARGCSSDADCPPGYICLNGRCVPIIDGKELTYGPVDYGHFDPVLGPGVPMIGKVGQQILGDWMMILNL